MHGRFSRTALGLCASLVLILSGCGGGSDNEPAATKGIISGTVATGSPLSGVVTAVGANGALANTKLNTAMMQAAQAVVNANLQSHFMDEGCDYL